MLIRYASETLKNSGGFMIINSKTTLAAIMAAGMAMTPVHAEAVNTAANAPIATESAAKTDDYDFIISHTLMNMKKGDTESLSVTQSEDATVLWSTSNPSAVQVDSDGTIIAVGNGQAVITAVTKDGHSASCTVTVTTEVSDVKMNNSDMTLDKGATIRLSSQIFPNDASDKSLTWYSNASDVASVDNEGTVHALKSGRAEITARASNGESDSITVTVKTPAESVQLDTDAIAFTIDTHGRDSSVKRKLTAQVGPADADDQKVTWSSSSQQVASVDDSGNVTPLKEGTAVITATTSNGKTASCKVTVSSKFYKVTEVKLSRTNETGFVGGTASLKVSEIAPTYASDKTITWTSSNPSVASVDGFGNVRFLSKGTAVIRAKSVDGPSDSCTFKVGVKHAESITLTGKASVRRGSTAKYGAVIAPTDASYKDVKFKSSNPKIAKIDKNGVLTGLRKGKVTITAYAAHDKKVKATKTVTVKVVDLKNAKARKSSVTLKKGKTMKLLKNVKLTPANTTEANFKWKASGKAIKVKNGVLTAVKKGTGKVTGTVNVKVKTKDKKTKKTATKTQKLTVTYNVKVK